MLFNHEQCHDMLFNGVSFSPGGGTSTTVTEKATGVQMYSG
jgi:hypothetical protein